MSCHYPSCMMGGGCCPYQGDCEKKAQDAWQRQEEKRLLDLEEQKLRIELMKKAIKEPRHD
jgi:ribosomal protein S10